MHFVDLHRRRSMGLGAVVLAGLASRLLGVGLGRSLGEGSGLTLARTLLLFKQAGVALDLGFQFGDATLERPATGTSGLIHTSKIAKCSANSDASKVPITPHRLTR
jgi:hypothetical protein